MQEGKTLKTLYYRVCWHKLANAYSPDTVIALSPRKEVYLDRYWEMFSEIDGDFEDVAIRTFKVVLPTKHKLRKSLTMKPTRSMCQLMDRIDEYKWVEEDQQQRKGIAKVIHPD